MAMTEFKDVSGVKIVNGVATKISTANLSNTPTAAELIAAFGPVADNAGKVYIANDNGGGTTVYGVICDGSSYFYHAFTKAS